MVCRRHFRWVWTRSEIDAQATHAKCRRSYAYAQPPRGVTASSSENFGEECVRWRQLDRGMPGGGCCGPMSAADLRTRRHAATVLEQHGYTQ